MPIYEYVCTACGHGLEALQRVTDAPLTDCPGCGRPELRKQVSAAGFRLKGSGWYATDFKGAAKSKPAQGEDGAAPDAAAAKGGADKAPAAGADGACGACAGD